MKNLTRFLAMLILFLVSCQKEDDEQPEDLLFLKPANTGSEKKAQISDDLKSYRFPDDILFKVSTDQVEILNNPLLEIEDYEITCSTEAMFTVNEENSIKTVTAQKLPFGEEDYGIQTETRKTKFNGILKSGDFVFAVNANSDKIKIKVLDLKDNTLTQTTAGIQNEALAFKVKDKIWKLWLTSISPRGNIFQFFTPDDNGPIKICYSLYLTN